MVKCLSGTRHRSLIASLSTGLSVIALLSSFPAFAQTETSPEAAQPASPEAAAQSQSDDAVGGDIVVTATRREQRTQSIGIAVSAYSGETLTRSGVLATTDLAAITPGLAITLVTPGQPALIAIRGISQSNYAVNWSRPTLTMSTTITRCCHRLTAKAFMTLHASRP